MNMIEYLKYEEGIVFENPEDCTHENIIKAIEERDKQEKKEK